MAVGVADPEAPKREDEIAKREADRFDPETQSKLAALRDHPDAVAARDGLDNNSQQLQNLENQAGKASGVDDASLENSDNLQNKEETSGWKTAFNPQTFQPKQPFNFNSLLKATRKKGPAATVILGLVIGLVLGGGFFGATLAPFMFISNVTLDLNDPASAIETRTVKQIAKTQFSTDSGSDKISAGCGLVGAKLSMKCKFKSISPWLEDKLKSVGIEVEGEKKIGGRTMPESYKYKGVSYTAEEFSVAIKGENPELWSAYRKALNMNWLALKGKTFITKVLGKFGLTDNPPELTGDHDEKTKQLMNGESGSANSGDPTFTEKVDADGNNVTDPDTKEQIWVEDSTGNEYTTSGKEARIKEVAVPNQVIDGSSKPMSQLTVESLENITKGINVIGMADAACSIRNMIGSGTLAAKISNAEQVAKYAMPIASLVGKLKAGDATAEDAQVIQEFFNNTDARKTITGLIEGKTENDKPTAGNVANPNFGKNAMDSELYKMSVGGGVAQTSESESSYSLGFGPKTIFQSIVSTGLNVTNLLDNAPGVSTCKIIQSGYVRAAGIGVGIAAFVASAFFSETGIGLGALALLAGKAVATIVAITAFTMAITHVTNAALSGNLISDVMEYAPVDRGSATWTGLSVLFGTSSQMRGMMPGSADQIVAYQQDQNEERQQVIAFERQQSNPLDITNQYSLTGSIVAAMGTHFSSSSESGLSSLPTSLSSFVFGGLTSSLSPYTTYAASMDSDRYKQCDDTAYQEIGIDADVQCNVRYIMPEQSMALDPLEVAQYMEDHKFIEPDSTTGYPKGYTPPAPEKLQSGAMNMVKGVVKSYAEGIIGTVYNISDTNYEKKYNDPYQNEEGGALNGAKYAKFLDYCVYRAMPYGKTYEEDGSIFGEVGQGWIDGSECRRTDDEDINNFRMYVFDMSVNDDLDGPVTADCPPGSTSTSTTASSGANVPTAEAINTMIKKSADANSTKSPLEGKGDKFIEFGQKYNVNPGVVTAILQRETQLASDGSSLYQPPFNNLGGNKASASDQGTCGAATWTDGNSYKQFCSIDDAIEGVFKNLNSDVYRKTDGTVAAVMEVYSPSNDGNDNGQAMYDIFGAVAKVLGITIDKSTQVYTNANTTTSSSSAAGNTVTGSKISESEIKTLITSYGLPAPQADGPTGYTELKSKLTSNEKAGWAAQQMLNGEKTWASKGGSIKLYLNTAWMWFETGSASWPDPYEMNCQNQTESTKATTVCPSEDFQAAGYQAANRSGDYVEVFKKLYGDTSPSTVMKSVIDNSSKASKDIWNYNDASNSSASSYYINLGSVTLNDIAPNNDFFDSKTQILTLILGKDPAMAAALNSFAVTDDDLIAVGFKGNGYGYIHDAEKQLISNMIMALYQFDGAGPSSAVCSAGRQAASTGGGAGIAAIWGGQGEHDLSYGFDYGPAAGPWYAYAVAYGMSGVTHTGTDIPNTPYAPVYSPVEGIVVCARNGEGEGIPGAGCAGAADYSGATSEFEACTVGYDPSQEKGAGTVMIKITKNGQETGDALRLGHLAGSLVKVGDKVQPHQQIGTVGCMNGWHTHVEYFIQAPGETSSGLRLVDPVKYLGGGS